jgi:hypothetical protein
MSARAIGMAVAVSAFVTMLTARSARAEDLPPLPPPTPPTRPEPSEPSAPKTSTPTDTKPPTPTDAKPTAPGDDIGLLEREPSLAPPSTSPPLPPDPNKRLRSYFNGQVGYALGRLFDIGEQQGSFHVGGGLQSNKLAAYGFFDLLYGSTSAGLRVYEGSLGAGADARLSRFRVGGGLYLGSLWVRRATYDDNVHAYAAGLFVHGSADVYAFGWRDDHAAYLDLAARGEGFIGGTTGQLVLSAGFRY